MCGHVVRTEDQRLKDHATARYWVDIAITKTQKTPWLNSHTDWGIDPISCKTKAVSMAQLVTGWSGSV